MANLGPMQKERSRAIGRALQRTPRFSITSGQRRHIAEQASRRIRCPFCGRTRW